MTTFQAVTRPTEWRPVTMHPIQNDAHIEYRLATLVHEADAERLAAAQRRLHRGEHEAHAATGLRRTVGRLLIGLGTAIAGSNPETGPGHVA